MGAFTLNMQTHGTVTRPYDFPPEIVDIYRAYCQMHQALRPYLSEQCTDASNTGSPVLRNMFFHDPTDESLFDLENQYLLGDGFLVAPMLEDGAKRDIHLPKGTWRCLFSGKIYDGKQVLKDFSVPFKRIPVFVSGESTSETLPDVVAALARIIQENHL